MSKVWEVNTIFTEKFAFPLLQEIFILLCIDNCPTRCKTKQSIYYSAISLYMFRVSITPIIKSTQNCNYSLRYCAATSLQGGQAWSRWREVAAQKIWIVPVAVVTVLCTPEDGCLATLEWGAAQKIWPVQETVVTVLCTPDDGCGWHPKHVEWTCRIINRLLYVASRWTIINIDQRCTET